MLFVVLYLYITRAEKGGLYIGSTQRSFFMSYLSLANDYSV